jgi:hypothetical protein
MVFMVACAPNEAAGSHVLTFILTLVTRLYTTQKHGNRSLSLLLLGHCTGSPAPSSKRVPRTEG